MLYQMKALDIIQKIINEGMVGSFIQSRKKIEEMEIEKIGNVVYTSLTVLQII